MAHPLLDRRDLTAQRDPRNAAPDGDGYYAELCAELAETNRLLRGMLTQDRAGIEQLCVTDREPAQATMENFPTVGARRLIVRRQGAGGLFALAAGVPLAVLQPNENRLGGTIVNAGAGAVTLFLAGDLLTPGGGSPLAQGAPQIQLVANGGTWDLRLGNLLWCGSVIAQAAANSSVTVVEV